MNNPHNCGVSYVVHILTALPVPLALPVLPVQRELLVQPEQKAPPVPPVPLALRVLPVRREPLVQPEQKAPPVPPALPVLPVLSRQLRLLPMQRVKRM